MMHGNMNVILRTPVHVTQFKTVNTQIKNLSQYF